MTTAHANCTHPATKAARAACRKGRKVEVAAPVDNLAAREAIQSSAPCADCFDWAMPAAEENLLEEGIDILSPEGRTEVYRTARAYLFDEGALAACPTHQHLL